MFVLAVWVPGFACAAGGESLLDGESLSLWWTFPFIALLACLAFFPVFASDVWHRHYGKISATLAALTIFALACSIGPLAAAYELNVALMGHYVPFVIMIASLYTVSGGIRVEMNTHGTPFVNTALLTIGTILAGWIGTTGASMLLIRPLLTINAWRTRVVHLIVFFIFLVSNIGGSATPLGDPPLFLGFLNGIDFFWTFQYLIPETVMVAVPLLILFYGIDTWMIRKESEQHDHSGEPLNITITGHRNFFYLAGIIGFVLLSGTWKPYFYLPFFGLKLGLQDVVRDVGLISILLISYLTTPHSIHKANHFNWEPLLEVGKIFFAVFVTVIPVIAILHAGEKGELRGLISLVTQNGEPVNAMYFWLTGILSAFLDNAPTYLIFFHMAGGDPLELMTVLAHTLEAISLGAVFMGAMTYIGNAPNFMVKAIAEHRGIQMPSFLGFMGWSIGILIPLFLLLTFIRFV